MARFFDTELTYGGRTNTNLVVSEGNAPAEKYLAHSAETVKFNYTFGPEKNNGVVLPKGKIVKASGLEYDVTTEKMIPTLKICGDNEVPLGVIHHNVYETRRDQTSSDMPTVLTREYIRLPLFQGLTAENVNKIHFGAAYTADASAMMGKYVVSDAYGNFREFVPTGGTADDPRAIIGQVYAVETDIPPAGFLQYFMEMTDNEYMDFIKMTGTQNIPSPGRTKTNAGTLNIDTFPVGSSYLKDRYALAKILKSFQAGIPFLTDGYFKARTLLTDLAVNDVRVAEVVCQGNVTYNPTNGTINCATANDVIGSMIYIKLDPKTSTLAKDAALQLNHDTGKYLDVKDLPEYANGPAPQGVVVKIDNVAVAAKNIHVDYYNNMIAVYMTAPVANKAVTITAVVLDNQIPGIPTGWDFKNNIGEARILLMK